MVIDVWVIGILTKTRLSLAGFGSTKNAESTTENKKKKLQGRCREKNWHVEKSIVHFRS